ncbi:hypothetical protein GCM10007857_42990 [Bradyrhizobium iriomotense]|uniref:Uncharacterized protein n=1 Tax=Bradyrhizobium iriomotense TaxID=441950 RepID=A0ABQ6B1A4_9BRAD|nr:hypothetical protein GCM10007857_42990 [Bradyrhizobium iriomotense]
MSEHAKDTGFSERHRFRRYPATTSKLRAETLDSSAAARSDRPHVGSWWLREYVAERRPKGAEYTEQSRPDRFVLSVGDAGGGQVVEGIAARMQVDEEIRIWNKGFLDKACDTLGRRAPGIAGETAIQIAVVKR